VATERFEYAEDGHNKFWELVPTNGGFNAFYGRINGKIVGPKFYVPQNAEKLKQQKLKKGYKKV
jgi:predicted DNA-binding WGR domain protein